MVRGWSIAVAVALAALLSACPPLVIGLDDDSSDDDPSWGTVVIDAVTPDTGGTEGGDVVEIRGQDLDGSGLEVRFGDALAAVTLIEDDRIQVTTPAADVPGSVDVVVENEYGADTLPAGFRYEFSGEGLDGGRVLLFYMAEPSSGGTLIEGQARLYAPDDWAWLEHLPANGACGYNIEAPTVLYDYLDAGDSVSLTTAQSAITLTRTTDDTGGPVYLESNVPVSSIEFNATYALEIPGGEGLPAMTIQPVMLSGSDFQVVDPDLAAPIMTTWARNPGATIQWTTGGTSDSMMLIQIISIDANLNPTGGNLTCTTTDSGGFVLGPTELAYLQNGYNALYVSRYDVTTWQNPHNGSEGHGAFVVSKIGVVWLQDF